MLAYVTQLQGESWGKQTGVASCSGHSAADGDAVFPSAASSAGSIHAGTQEASLHTCQQLLWMADTAGGCGGQESNPNHSTPISSSDRPANEARAP